MWAALRQVADFGNVLPLLKDFISFFGDTKNQRADQFAFLDKNKQAVYSLKQALSYRMEVPRAKQRNTQYESGDIMYWLTAEIRKWIEKVTVLCSDFVDTCSKTIIPHCV